MKTLRTVEIQYEYVDGYMPKFEQFKDNTIYISKQYSVAIHKCLCGCGEQIVTPTGKGEWNIIEKDGKISMTPSIGNFQIPCKSHYIITKNKANFV